MTEKLNRKKNTEKKLDLNVLELQPGSAPVSCSVLGSHLVGRRETMLNAR